MRRPPALTRQTLEKYQVLVYLAFIAMGLALGAAWPNRVDAFESLLWPLLGALLYVTFTQVPLTQLSGAWRDTRFMAAAVVGNFLLLPLVAWGLANLFAHEPAIRLGMLLVLLVPCTDWFITFSHLGGGNARHAIAFAPISLLLQIALLPVYLWLFLDQNLRLAMVQRELLLAFAGLIVLPLLLAFVTEAWAQGQPRREAGIERLGWLPVPLLGLVVFSIAATQVGTVADSLPLLGGLLLAFVGFLVAAALLARVLTSVFRLPTAQGRVLAFSLGTRNSFVVLPLALALPASYEPAVVAIVFQSLVELIGMALFLWWVPRGLFPSAR
ncbi:arsenic resistance protein [Halomonas sp. MCCC 1A17488]|uniref:arsenic resistance protein n=1 Tax=unclassified Halomonas TaxID=2609666 RepID=UPI001F30AEA4|nr:MULTISPECIES: arsenic resistance protein [unclassified Halomonas]MCE8016546.1 arsenic resistance protein [Halomonas sp. MCCC 1A17488]MCG3239879.1 arsenic resistance protein [Halomonas sp. MCCC 1A17488]